VTAPRRARRQVAARLRSSPVNRQDSRSYQLGVLDLVPPQPRAIAVGRRPILRAKPRRFAGHDLGVRGGSQVTRSSGGAWERPMAMYSRQARTLGCPVNAGAAPEGPRDGESDE
jgi:hypothetical protein